MLKIKNEQSPAVVEAMEMKQQLPQKREELYQAQIDI